jgi:CBS domain-containing protein
MTVSDISTKAVITAHPDETVVEAARRMRDRHVGDLVVTDTQGRPVGLLTDRDIVVSAVAQSPDRLSELLVGDVMTSDPATVRGAEPLNEALTRMRTLGIRRLPVVSPDGRIEGIVAFDDVVAFMSRELGKLAAVVTSERLHEREMRKPRSAAEGPGDPVMPGRR